MVAVAAAGHAAHVHLHEARPGEHAATGGAVAQAGDQLGIVAERLNVLLFQLRIAQHLQADRHLLQVFLALLRGHRDGVEGARLLVFLGGRRGLLRPRRGGEGQRDGGGQRDLAELPVTTNLALAMLACVHRGLPLRIVTAV